MSIYRYAGLSAVGEITFHHAGDRFPVALLAAGENAAPERLASICTALEENGWQAVPAYSEGKPVLQVSGFEKEAELEGFLSGHGFVKGAPSVTSQPGDDSALTFREKVGRHSLKIAGVLNLVGNAGLVADGIKTRDAYRLAGAGLLTVSALNLARYGSARPGHYTRELAGDLAGFIHARGDGLPEDSSLASINRHRQERKLGSANDFLYRHPAQVTLGISSLGAVAMLISGIKRSRSDSKEWGALGFGISSLALKLASLLIPERSAEEKKQKTPGNRTFAEKAADWVQEKPLRVYGIGSLITDAFLGASAFQEYKKSPGKQGYLFTAGATASYVLADIMLAISSKNHVNTDGKFDADEQRGIEALAAEALACRSEAARAPMARELGKFLVSRKEMKGSAESISRSILEQAGHMRENPWSSRITRDESPEVAR